MLGIFDPPHGPDPDYIAYATGDWPKAREGRAFLESLFEETEPYLDDQLERRCRHSLQQAFWEMYTCAALRKLGLPVQQRQQRRKATNGPDLQVGSVDAWVEAIAVVAGNGPDQVLEAPLGVASRVPHDEIKLRLTGAIAEKHKAYERYVKSGLVRANEPFVVAVNAGKVPSSRLELDVPRIVSAVYPIGWPSVGFHITTGAVRSLGHVHQPTVGKASGALVETDGFLSGRYAGISAALYSASDPLNRPERIGDDFICVHNHTASVRLPMGYFARGREYWMEGDQLCMKWHT